MRSKWQNKTILFSRHADGRSQKFIELEYRILYARYHFFCEFSQGLIMKKNIFQIAAFFAALFQCSCSTANKGPNTIGIGEVLSSPIVAMSGTTPHSGTGRTGTRYSEFTYKTARGNVYDLPSEAIGRKISNPAKNDSGKSRICVFRARRFVGWAGIAKIRQNGIGVGYLESGNCLSWEVPANKDIRIDAICITGLGYNTGQLTSGSEVSQPSIAVTLRPKSGKTYCFDASISNPYILPKLVELQNGEDSKRLSEGYAFVEPIKANGRYASDVNTYEIVDYKVNNRDDMERVAKYLHMENLGLSPQSTSETFYLVRPGGYRKLCGRVILVSKDEKTSWKTYADGSPIKGIVINGKEKITYTPM